MSASPLDRKRRRADSWLPQERPVDKKARPTTIQSPDGERLWYPRDSVIGSQHVFTEHAKYDSDDQSSLVSEPGSPQALSQVSEEDVSMLSDNEDTASHAARTTPSSSWRSQLRIERVATPVLSPISRLAASHVRSRHPQENLSSSDRLDVPSPIDEDEVPTPPSAAEAAGSQLELLTVSDVEMGDCDNNTPTIAVHEERSLQLDGSIEQMDSTPNNTLLLRKTRARSGALSGGGSPMRESSNGDDSFGGRKGFSMGYRADCEKCQQKVPGHMNHFY